MTHCEIAIKTKRGSERDALIRNKGFAKVNQVYFVASGVSKVLNFVFVKISLNLTIRLKNFQNTFKMF